MRTLDAAAQHADHTGVRDPRADFHAKGPEMIRDKLGGSGFAIGELGVLMDVTPPGEDFARHLSGAPVDFGSETCRLGEAGDREGQQSQGDQSHAVR